MFKVLFSDNWDAHDDTRYVIAEGFFSRADTMAFVAESKHTDSLNGEDNRWTYHVIRAV